MYMKRLIPVIVMLFSSIAALAQPTFKGGEPALATFLKDHIVYPEFSAKNCIGGTIEVHFRVYKNGKVDHVAATKGLGIDLDDEAVRVVKMTRGKWILRPGIEAANLTIPIRFAPDMSRCAGITQMNREQAIVAYRNRQELENAVTNYYENKYAGKADTSKESYIIALKKQLGFDDELIDDVLQQAADKLKQGDQDGACADWKFIRNIGSNRADKFIAQYCK